MVHEYVVHERGITLCRSLNLLIQSILSYMASRRAISMPWFELITLRCLYVAYPDIMIFSDTNPADTTDAKKSKEGPGFAWTADPLWCHRPDARPVNCVHRCRDRGY